MQAHVDKFGRAVISKALRDGTGIEAGDALQVERDGDRIVLEPLQEEGQLGNKQGVMVYRGTAARDLAAAVKEHRRNRMAGIGIGDG